MSCEELFIKALKERGFRMTPQREMVLSVMHDGTEPVTAEDVYARVQLKTSTVDISTVYRTLELLQEFHLVKVIDKGEKQRLFELVGVEKPHVHLACTHCGAISGVEMEVFEALLQRLSSEYGFAADMGQLTITGLCRNCRENSNEG